VVGPDAGPTPKLNSRRHGSTGALQMGDAGRHEAWRGATANRRVNPARATAVRIRASGRQHRWRIGIHPWFDVEEACLHGIRQCCCTRCIEQSRARKQRGGCSPGILRQWRRRHAGRTDVAAAQPPRVGSAGRQRPECWTGVHRAWRQCRCQWPGGAPAANVNRTWCWCRHAFQCGQHAYVTGCSAAIHGARCCGRHFSDGHATAPPVDDVNTRDATAAAVGVGA